MILSFQVVAGIMYHMTFDVEGKECAEGDSCPIKVGAQIITSRQLKFCYFHKQFLAIGVILAPSLNVYGYSIGLGHICKFQLVLKVLTTSKTRKQD